MSRFSLYLRRRKIDRAHATRRALAGLVAKRGFEIGDFTYGEPEIMPWGTAHLKIGKYCSIARDVTIFLGGNHHTSWVSTFPFKRAPGFPEAATLEGDPEYSRGDVVVGSDVWIGAGATILSGVTIGHGAAIGAGAMVSRDVPPYAIVAGNPAQTIRRRFSDVQIEALLDLAWWDLARDQIVPLLPLLSGPDIDAFIEVCRRVRAQTGPARY